MDEVIKLLVYSPPGHGKTYLVGTGTQDERLSPILLVDFEGGTRSIRSKTELITIDELTNHVPTPGKITVLRVDRFVDFNDIYDFLDSEKNPYRTVVLDSLSEIHYLSLNTVIGDAAKKNSRHDPDVAEQADYLKSIQQMRKLIRYFRDLPMNVIFTAGVQDGENPRTRRTEAQPSFIGKLTREVPGLVDVVGYLAVTEEENGTIKRILLTSPTDRFMAKARNEEGALPDLENPTLPALLDALGVPRAVAQGR